MSWVTDPEPCDDCATGIMYFVCFDGVRRCRNCVREYAHLMGWDEPPPPPPVPAPPPEAPPPPPPPTTKQSKIAKAIEDEREIRQSQQTLV